MSFLTEKPMAGADTWKEPTRIWNSAFVSIFLASSVLQMGQQMSNALLSVYAKSLNAPADQIGELASLFAVTALIFRFVSGPAMNAFDRRKLVGLGLGFMMIAYLGFATAPYTAAMLGVEAITVLKVFRLVQGIGNAFGSACCLTIVTDTLPKDQFTTGMGYYGLAQAIAQAIGPRVGVLLRDSIGYNNCYFVFVGVMAVAIILATRVRTAPRIPAKFELKPKNMIAREALTPSLITLLVYIGFASISAFMLLYSEERNIAGGSYFFTVYALAMLVTRPLVGKLTDKLGFVNVAIPSILLTAVSLALIGYAQNTWVLLGAAFVNAFGYGAVQPMLQALAMKSVTPDRRGSASATNSICMDVGTIIGPSICGMVANVLGYTPVMWLTMCVPIVCAAIYVFCARNYIRRIETDFQGTPVKKA